MDLLIPHASLSLEPYSVSYNLLAVCLEYRTSLGLVYYCTECLAHRQFSFPLDAPEKVSCFEYWLPTFPTDEADGRQQERQKAADSATAAQQVIMVAAPSLPPGEELPKETRLLGSCCCCNRFGYSTSSICGTHYPDACAHCVASQQRIHFLGW